VVDGRDTTRHSVQALAAHVGYVFQNPNHQLFAATVAEELAFGPRNLRLPPHEVDARVAEAVEFFDLGAIVGLHPYRISFPLRKLVGIASIFTMRPRVFILDEPSTGQDHRSARVIERLIARLGERGDTVICVSHDMPLIAHVARRALVLWNGALIADGPPREVFADRATMEPAHLAPPQISRLSARMPGREGRPLALTVAELAAEVRGGPPAPAANGELR
jgi:energy-coupling factor transport system ATP-binding protein